MRVRGALHVHSSLSRDGSLTIAELAQWYGSRGYRFLALSEHAEDLDAARSGLLAQGAVENSSSSFCIIPGMEFRCEGDIHIVGLGAVGSTPPSDPLAVIEVIHQQGGWAVLAHPQRIGWDCPVELLRALDAIEIWNVPYDGRFVPRVEALSGFPRFQRANPDLLAVAGHDFHRRTYFYDVAIEMEVASLVKEAILGNLRHGRYVIRSRLFSTDSQFRLSRWAAARLRFLIWQCENLRKLRSLLRRRAT